MKYLNLDDFCRVFCFVDGDGFYFPQDSNLKMCDERYFGLKIIKYFTLIIKMMYYLKKFVIKVNIYYTNDNIK